MPSRNCAKTCSISIGTGLPAHMKTPEMAKAIADIMNHATGSTRQGILRIELEEFGFPLLPGWWVPGWLGR